jgi:hypothetical protein
VFAIASALIPNTHNHIRDCVSTRGLCHVIQNT